MEKQSSYIFLRHPFKHDEKEVEKTSKSVLKFNDNVNKSILKVFPTSENIIDDEDYFIKKYKYDIAPCSVTFTIHIAGDIEYLDISVEGKEESAIIECLEKVQNDLLNSGIRSNYIDIISYDAISEYYCNKIFVKLNKFERNLRKLFFNIYILNFGKEYYQATISKPITDNIKKLIKSETTGEQRGKIKSNYNLKNNDEVTEILMLQKFFYSFEFGDILNFLFEPHFTEYDKKTTEKFLSEHSDLSKLTDKELRAAFYKFLPKSDWNRFFSDKIKIDNIKELIDEIRKYRNSVAHFKFFYKNDYDECNRKVTRLNKAIIKAIRITEEKDFAERNNLNEKNNSIIILEAINKLSKQMSEPPESIISIIIALAQMRSNLAIDSQIPQIPIPNIQSEDDKIDFSDHDIDDKDEAAADDNT